MKRLNNPINQLSIYGESQNQIIWYEFNLFMRPVFSVKKKDTGTGKIINIDLTSDDGVGFWRVSPNVDYGAGGPVEDAVWTALNKIFTELPKPLANPIDIGPIAEIERILKHKRGGGETTSRIKEAIKRINSLLISSQYAFFDKKQGKLLRESDGGMYIITKYIFKGDHLEDGTIAEKNQIWLDDKILNSINVYYVTPVDIDYYMGLGDTERVLFKQLLYMFFANRHKNEPIFPLYSTLCKNTTLVAHSTISQVEQQLSRAHNTFLKDGFINKVLFEKKKGGKNSKKDWKIFYWPGSLAKKYISVKLPARKEISNIDVAAMEEGGIVPKKDIAMLDTAQSLFKSDDQKRVNDLADFYIKCFSVRFGERPLLDIKRDIPILESLLRQYSFEKLCVLFTVYFDTKDNEFINKTGYIIPAFKAVVNKLIIDWDKKIKKMQRDDKELGAAPTPDTLVDRDVMKKMISEFMVSWGKSP